MNKRDYIVLAIIANCGQLKHRELALKSGFSLGLINSSIKKLIEDEWLNDDFSLTAKSISYIKGNKPENAVILAAGAGLRMIPAQKIPKGLITIDDEVLIERLIRQLHEINITDITIVVGYMAERYEYLTEKYNVKCIFNNNFTTQDNMYSLYLAKEKLANTYIVPCDIFFSKNPFKADEFFPWYGVSEFTDDDSFIRVNRKMELVKTEYGGNSMIGIAYMNQKASRRLVSTMKILMKKHTREKMIWEDALFQGDKLIIPYAKIMRGQNAFSIKTYEDLRDIDNDSEHLKSKRINLISDVFSVSTEQITDISALYKGMTNRLMRFRVDEKPYLLRVPGEGSNKLTNRKNEAKVYEAIKDSGICDTVLYMNPNDGFKISEFLENATTCKPDDFDEVGKCLASVRKLHELNIKVEHTFDPFSQLEYYETLRNEKSSFADYDKTRENIFKLKNVLSNFKPDICLCHIDPICDNFLLDGDKVVLIDWEYSGMCDKYIDVAFFCIYSNYSKENIDRIIELYCTEDVTDEIKIKIYSYIAVTGLLWTVWCEYKALNGVPYVEYMLSQYQYARKYYKIATELYNEKYGGSSE